MFFTMPRIGSVAYPPSAFETPSSVVQFSPSASQRTGSAERATHGSVE